VWWVTILDLLVGMFNCNWRSISTGATHGYWEDVSCISMPHLAHMLVALVVLIVFVLTVVMMVRPPARPASAPG
jgi:hypothetical protein